MLLEKLTELDFMAVDLQLYLDTHPYDKKALEKYNETVKEANVARVTFEKFYGPLFSFRSEAGNEFRWIDEPWPWQYEMNFEMMRED
jgi:spore coat protein JB